MGGSGPTGHSRRGGYVSIESALAMAFGLFLLLHGWEMCWRGKAARSLRLATLRTTIELLRTVALLATLVYTLLALCIVLLGLIYPQASTTEAITTALTGAHSLRALVSEWSNHISYIAFGVTLMGLVFLLRRRSRKLWGERSAQVGEAVNGRTRDASATRSRIETIAISRGLHDALGGGSRFLFKSGLGLLLVCLVAVSGEIAGEAADRHVIMRLEMLRLEYSTRDALASFARADVASAGKVREVTPDQESREDQEALDYLAWRFEESVGRALIYAVDNRGRLPPTMPDVRSTLRLADESDYVFDQLSPIELASVAIYRESVNNVDRPKTALGRVFREDLEVRVVRRSPLIWASVRDRFQTVKASFRQPMTSHELDGLVFSHIFGMAIDLPSAPADGLGVVARELVNEVTSSVAQSIYENARAQALGSLVEAENIDDVFDNVLNEQTQHFGVAKNVVGKVRDAMSEVPRAASVLTELRQLCIAALTARRARESND